MLTVFLADSVRFNVSCGARAEPVLIERAICSTREASCRKGVRARAAGVMAVRADLTRVGVLMF